MFVTDRSIRLAVGEAVECTQQYNADRTNDVETQRRDEVVPLPAIGDTDGTYYTDLSLLSDDTLVPDLYQTPSVQGGNEVITRSPAQLFTALEALCVQTGTYVLNSTAELEIGHEDQHADSMRSLGMHTVHYGLRVLTAEPKLKKMRFQLFTNAVSGSGPLTKLEVASLFVAPEEPSDSDLRRVHDMGYSGIDDVAQRIIARDSAQGRRDMMVPFGYSGDLNGAVYL